jgi:hypothetical protein
MLILCNYLIFKFLIYSSFYCFYFSCLATTRKLSCSMSPTNNGTLNILQFFCQPTAYCHHPPLKSHRPLPSKSRKNIVCDSKDITVVMPWNWFTYDKTMKIFGNQFNTLGPHQDPPPFVPRFSRSGSAVDAGVISILDSRVRRAIRNMPLPQGYQRFVLAQVYYLVLCT